VLARVNVFILESMNDHAFFFFFFLKQQQQQQQKTTIVINTYKYDFVGYNEKNLKIIKYNK